MISSRCVALLVMLVPAMALTSAVGGPAVIYLTALISLVVLASNAFTRRQLFDFRELMPMAVALFAPFTAMLISSIWLGVWSASEIEKLLRFALAVPVCWLLLRAPRHWLQHVQWSLLFAAYAGSIMLSSSCCTRLGRGFVSEYGGRYNAVAFADLTLLFGVMSIVTLPWTLTRWARFEAALKIFALPLTLAAVCVPDPQQLGFAAGVRFGVPVGQTWLDGTQEGDFRGLHCRGPGRGSGGCMACQGHALD